MATRTNQPVEADDESTRLIGSDPGVFACSISGARIAANQRPNWARTASSVSEAAANAVSESKIVPPAASVS